MVVSELRGSAICFAALRRDHLRDGPPALLPRVMRPLVLRLQHHARPFTRCWLPAAAAAASPRAGGRDRAARRRARPAPGPPRRRRSWTAAAPGPPRVRAWIGRRGANAAPAPRPRMSMTPTRTHSAATSRSTARGTCHSCAEQAPPPPPRWPGTCCASAAPALLAPAPEELHGWSPRRRPLLLRHAHETASSWREGSGSKQRAIKQQAL